MKKIALLLSVMIILSLCACHKAEPDEQILMPPADESEIVQDESEAVQDKNESAQDKNETVQNKNETVQNKNEAALKDNSQAHEKAVVGKKNVPLVFEKIPRPDKSDIRTSYSMFYKKDKTKICVYDFSKNKEIVLTENYGELRTGTDSEKPLTNLEGNIAVYTDSNSQKQKSAPLYVFYLDSEKKVKLCDNATFSHMSDDGKYVYYVTQDNTIFLYYTKDGKTEIVASKVKNFIFSRHGKTAFYMIGDVLYAKNAGKNPVEVDRKVIGFENYASYGNVLYYAKEGNILCAADGNGNSKDLVVLSKDQFPYVLNAGGVVFYEGEKNTVCPLYYFDGKEKKLLTKRHSSVDYLQWDEYFTFRELKDGVDIDINSDEFINNIEKYTNCYFVIDGVVSKLPSDRTKRFYVTGDRSKIYYITNYDHTEKSVGNHHGQLSPGDLYEISITNKKAGEPKLYDTNVTTIMYYNYAEPEDRFIYYKAESKLSNSTSGTLYCNKKKIADNAYDAELDSFSNKFLVFTEGGSTLYLSENEKLTKISDYVISSLHHFLKNGDVVFGTDKEGVSSCCAYEYTLNLYKGGKITEFGWHVYTHKFLNDDGVVFIDEGGTLYAHKDGKTRTIAQNVLNFGDTFDGYRTRKYFVPEGMEFSSISLYY